MKLLLELFFVFFKVAISTFGGGYAMLPMLRNELIKKRSWISEQDLVDYFAISQCTPGIIGVNIATFVGYRYKGKIGAILATLGMIAPSIIIVTLVAALLSVYIDNPYVMSALKGVRVLMIALIFYTAFVLGKKAILDYATAFIFVLSLVLIIFLDIHIVLLILLSVTLGNLFPFIKKRSQK